ncbi:alpha-E domain-containing protein [Bordetella sp. LUAb4]|uniref:alpha-E domain-containing protein n=1 Tax=Bordetella sp. LUAb4 TaxID=2843195 RepID=UPI001E54BABE|nr:alpha-E domain-containing protein [Bordetella sp. LUAb4]
MLSRTADNLFWMCRYVERAENTARMLDVNLQMSLLPQDEATRERSWRALMRISELQNQFDERYPEGSPRDVLRFMVRDEDNPSSIYACLRLARENARAVRGSLTTEVWETYNTTWLELLKHLRMDLPERNPGEFFEWVKFRSHVARGVMIGTMLEDEALHFLRLGMYLERADNMARMLDVKFYEYERDDDEGGEQGVVLADPRADISSDAQAEVKGRAQADGEAPSAVAERPAAHTEFYRWAAILTSVSGLEIYRKVYRDVITPDRVAELLMLHGDMPRSLLASMRAVAGTLALVSNDRSAETERRAGKLCADLQYARVEDILSGGLHRYLEQFLDQTKDLGNRIGQDFLLSTWA